jgi:hypothetical protein
MPWVVSSGTTVLALPAGDRAASAIGPSFVEQVLGVPVAGAGAELSHELER